MDKDGKMELSNVVRMLFGNAATIGVTPNPAHSIIMLSLNNFTAPALIQVLNNYGQVIRQKSVARNTVNTPMDINGLRRVRSKSYTCW